MSHRARLGVVAIATMLFAPGVQGVVSPRVGRAARHGVSAKPLRESAPGPKSQVQNRKPQTSGKAHPGPSAPIEQIQFDGSTANDNLPFFKDIFPPPDANGAAGYDRYFQTINRVFRIFDKD